MLINDDPHVQRALGLALLGGGKRGEDFTQAFQGRFPAELMDDILFGLRDHEAVADRPATLGHDGSDAHGASHGHTDDAGVHDRVIEEEAVRAGLLGAAGHAADGRSARKALV